MVAVRPRAAAGPVARLFIDSAFRIIRAGIALGCVGHGRASRAGGADCFDARDQNSSMARRVADADRTGVAGGRRGGDMPQGATAAPSAREAQAAGDAGDGLTASSARARPCSATEGSAAQLVQQGRVPIAMSSKHGAIMVRPKKPAARRGHPIDDLPPATETALPHLGVSTSASEAPSSGLVRHRPAPERIEERSPSGANSWLKKRLN